MASPNEAQIQAYINAQVSARVDAAIAEITANMNSGGAKPSKPETYDGRRDPEIWLYGVELYYAASSIVSEYTKIAFADALLRGDALIWRRTTDSPATWEEWKALLISAFQPVNPTETARDLLARLRQTTSVSVFAAIFRATILRIPHITDDEKKDRFIRGLKPKIMHDVKMRAPDSFDEAVRLAVRLDSLDIWRPSNPRDHGRTGNSNPSRPEPMDLDVHAVTSTPAALHPYVNAIIKSRPGTPTAFNSRPPRKPLTDREREDFRKKGICFKCRRSGHMARECPENLNSYRQ